MPSDIALQAAVRAWCTPRTSHLEMIPELAEAFAEVLDEFYTQSACIEVVPSENHELRQIIEIGCVFVADWGDEFRLMRNVTPVEAQSYETPVFAVVGGGQEGYRISVLVAFIVAEHMKDGKVELPDFLTEGIKFGADLQVDDDPGASGNLGNVSDNANVQLLGPDGHPARKMLDAISPTNCSPEVRPTL